MSIRSWVGHTRQQIAPAVLRLDTSKGPSRQFSLSLAGCDVLVDWGDGSPRVRVVNPTLTPQVVLKTYAANDIYKVRVSGNADSIATTANQCLTDVISFGQLNTKQFSFLGSENLTSLPTELPASVTSLNAILEGCTRFNQSVDAWDVSRITDFRFAFADCVSFNQPLASWVLDGPNRTGLVNARSMFEGCTVFNQPLSSWRMGSVNNAAYMFLNCSAFNQNLNNWDVRAVTTMTDMFRGCSLLNQPFNLWDVSNAVRVGFFFKDCTSFNRNISAWDIRAATETTELLAGCTAITTANWDALLVAWNGRKATYAKTLLLSCPAKTSTAGGGAAAKAALVAYGWTIIDGGNV